MILLALPRKQPLNRDELMQLARKASAARRFPFDLGDPVQYGFLDARAKSQHGRVLRDRDLEQGGRNSLPYGNPRRTDVSKGKLLSNP